MLWIACSKRWRTSLASTPTLSGLRAALESRASPLAIRRILSDTIMAGVGYTEGVGSRFRVGLGLRLGLGLRFWLGKVGVRGEMVFG